MWPPSLQEQTSIFDTADHEITTFKNWAARRAGESPYHISESLRRDHPFITAILEQRHTPHFSALHANHLCRIRRRIEGRDRRCSNRRRKTTNAYLGTRRTVNGEDSGVVRYAQVLRRVAIPEGVHTQELTERLLSDLEAIQETLAEQGRTAEEVMHRGMACLKWEWDAEEVEDQNGYKHDLGTYTLYLGSEGCVWGMGGDYKSNGYCHPHLSTDGAMCLGDFQNFKTQLSLNGALMMVFDNVCRLICSYNHSSPYIEMGRLMGEDDECSTCAHCGEEINPEESYYVDDDHYCEDCAWRCDICEEYFTIDTESIECRNRYHCPNCASDHLHQCVDCDEWVDEAKVIFICDEHGDSQAYCKDCVVECSDCGDDTPKDTVTERNNKYYCPDCMVECEDCGEELPKEDATEICDCHYCSDCVSSCDECGDKMANESSVSLDGKRCCPDCVATCDMCDETVLSADSNYHNDGHDLLQICDKCHETLELP